MKKESTHRMDTLFFMAQNEKTHKKVIPVDSLRTYLGPGIR